MDNSSTIEWVKLNEKVVGGSKITFLVRKEADDGQLSPLVAVRCVYERNGIEATAERRFKRAEFEHEAYDVWREKAATYSATRAAVAAVEQRGEGRG